VGHVDGAGGADGPVGASIGDPPIDTAELQSRLRRGDPTAFNTIYRRYTPGLFAFLARLTRRSAIAEELLQETWMRFATHAPTLPPDANVRAWLFTVARNLFRSHRRRSLLDLDSLRFWRAAARDTAPVPSPQELAVASETERRLEQAVAALPLAQRELLLLVAVEGFTPLAAAAIAGISAVTARQRLHRARAALARALEGLDETSDVRPDPGALPRAYSKGETSS
jgi:RNA polymerase sigma-70 factor (ECF subfamily)